MRQSRFFVRTLREPPSGEESVNAKLLEQAGFVQKVAAGIYNFLPLGLRVLDKIENIVREEMNAAGGIELLMPALHPKENWQKTGRFESFAALLKITSRLGTEYALGPTHEEIMYPLLTHYLSSYKDLPIALYQIQTKFRDEERPKAGLLRTREFRMKDLYSFHVNDRDRDVYYNVMRRAYLKIFRRLGLEAVETEASGGTFSERSLEFQVLAPAGEDSIFICTNCRKAINREVGGSSPKCPECGGPTGEKRAIEAGNIFPLKKKFAEDFHAVFRDKDGREKFVSAGCYGFGTSRAMGTIVEVSHDEKGILWPENVAPFRAHLISLHAERSSRVHKVAEELYRELEKRRIETLYDDRKTSTAGEKFADADLIGIPYRVVVSAKALQNKKIEVKKRGATKAHFVRRAVLPKLLAERSGFTPHHRSSATPSRFLR